MSDLKIPSLNKKTDKYLFKNKFSSRRKTKRKLIIESFYMFVISLLLVYINYLIPSKALFFKNFIGTTEKSFFLLIDLIVYLSQLLLVIFILISFVFSLILFLGSFYRLIKVLKPSSKQF